MRRAFLFLIFTAFGLQVLSQDKTSDSLKELINFSREDTTTVNWYILLTNSYLNANSSSNTNLDSYYVYAKKALDLSNKINWLRGRGACELLMSEYFSLEGNYPKSLSLKLSSLKIFQKLKDSTNIIQGLVRVGDLYTQVEDYNRSVGYLKEAYELAKVSGYLQGVFSSAWNLGINYIYLKIADSALIYCQELYQLSKSYSGNKESNLFYALFGLGKVHLLMNNTDLALSYLRGSLPHALNLNSTGMLWGIYNTFSDVFSKMGNADSSLFYSNKALGYALKRKKKNFELRQYKQLAELYKGRNNDSAVKYYQLYSQLRDSIFTAQKKNEMDNIISKEEERQREIVATELKAKEEHILNLQYAAIAIALITLITVFLLLSRTIIVKTKFIEFFGVLGLLAVFEFINLIVHPYLAHATNDSPLFMLLILIGIGALLVPLHHRIEKWMTKVMVEKNKKIRLDAAKKTIEQLGDKTR